MKKIFLILGFLLCTPHSQAFSNSVALDEAFEAKWVREFIVKAYSSKDLAELADHLGTVQNGDALELRLHTEPHHKVPQISYKDHTISFDQQMHLKIISLQTYEFRLNGHYFKYDRNKTMFENLRLVQKALQRKESAKFLWPFAFLDKLQAATVADSDDEADDDDDSKDDLFYGPYEQLYSDPTKISDDSMVGWALISPVMLADFLVSKGESFLSRSCDKQVSDLNRILEENKLGLQTAFCGSDYRGSDRKVTFWVPKASGKSADKKVFNLDYRLGALREEGTDKLMLFNYDSLKEVRELKYTKDGHSYRMDYHPNSPEFEQTKTQIEPYRKVLFYMGANRTCDKCARELREKVATKIAPSYLNAHSGAAAKSAKRTHKSGRQ